MEGEEKVPIPLLGWLHLLNTELLDEEELLELKVPLSKLFEPDLCPLPFEAHRLFEFICVRLTDENAYEEVLKALDWLHVSFLPRFSNNNTVLLHWLYSPTVVDPN